MGKAYSIWTPVVIGRLKSPHRINREKVFTVDKNYKAMEDIIVKIKECQVTAYGQNIELLIKLDILCLLEDINGRLNLTVKQETIRENLNLADFDNYIEENLEIKYILDTKKISSYGELTGNGLKVIYFLEIAIIATSEQIIRISLADEMEIDEAEVSWQSLINGLQAELELMAAEKIELKRKLFLYERNIFSLKKGLLKAENRNVTLNQEINNYLDIIEQLKEAIKEKEQDLSHSKNLYYKEEYTENDASLGSRIKKMFLTS
ncbi:MAG: hypothetical protein GX333_03785 [Syntrophomonadaceae bacterium]|nr:hypothetical protein [Syntrophomonadaceae bacterium]